MYGRKHLPQLFAVIFLICAAMVAGYGVAAVVWSALASGHVARDAAAGGAPPARQTAVLGVEDSAEGDFAETAIAQPPLPEVPTPVAAVPGAPSASSLASDGVEGAPAVPVTTQSAPAPTGAPATATAAQLTPVEIVKDSFDRADSGWIQREAPTWSAAYAGGQYRLATNGQQAMNVASSLDDPDYRVTADISVERGSGGIVFLAAKPAVFYRFVISNDGTFAVQRQAGGQVTNVVDWTAIDALQRPAGTTYRVRVERRGNLVQCVVDDLPVLDWTTPARDVVGQYGLAVASADGQAAAAFDNLIVERLEQ